METRVRDLSSTRDPAEDLHAHLNFYRQAIATFRRSRQQQAPAA
jgi:hypothetical protein